MEIRDILHFPKIYPITDIVVSGMSHADQIRLLVKGGAELIQLREKRLFPRDWFDDARSSVAIARKAGVRLIINDRVDIAAAIGADGVHLGQDDLPPFAAREILGASAIIGFSTHNIEQVREAVKMPIDYLAFGPIFSTVTKRDADPTVGLRLLAEVKSYIGDLPLVAIGGIDGNNLSRVLAAGADSAAMISSILKSESTIDVNLRAMIRAAC
ncbi:MAG: thiamine phosphate synthase [Acidobacteriota bacterium]